MDDAGPYYPCWSSLLYGLIDDVDPRPLMDQLVSLGFDGVRVFTGYLEPRRGGGRVGKEQRSEDAVRRLPAFIQHAHDRELAVLAVAVTDSALSDYALRPHCLVVAACNPDIMEIANETYHATQRSDVHRREYLLELYTAVKGSGYRGLVALGADAHDELRPPNEPDAGRYGMRGADFNTAHLNRNKPPAYREATRLRELLAVADVEGVPSLSGEPRRAEDSDNPLLFAYLLGLLGRGFNLGTVFHSAQARDAEVLTGVQLEAAKAFVRGHQVLRGTAAFQFKNAKWPDSPVHDALFFEPESQYPGPHRCWRAHSFLGERSYTVLSGPPVARWQDTGVTFKNGWSPKDVVDSMPGCYVLEIEQA